MFGHFSPESLAKFQELNGLESSQNFSEGVFDFKVCQKPDGKHYGIPDDSKCSPPAKEVKKRPDTGFLNSQAGRGINYDTAKKQGEEKNLVSLAAKAYSNARRNGLPDWEAQGKAVDAIKSKLPKTVNKGTGDTMAPDDAAREFFRKKGLFEKWSKQENASSKGKDTGMASGYRSAKATEIAKLMRNMMLSREEATNLYEKMNK